MTQRKLTMTMVAIAVLCSLSYGQDQSPPVVSRTGFDLVRVGQSQFTVPLRYGSIVKDTDQLDLDGRILQRGKDYSINLEAGTIMLLVPRKAGALLRVTYQYNPAAKHERSYADEAAKGSGLAGFTFQLAPGARATMGLGFAERLADGTTLVSNIYGMQNSFNLRGSQLKGAFYVGQRQKSESVSLFGDANQGQVEDGNSTAIVQSFRGNALGGAIEADYQDIDDRFAAFSALGDTGVNPSVLEKEKGLKRAGVKVSNLLKMPLKPSFGMRSVGTDKGSIIWRNAGLEAMGLKLDWSQTKVDSTFTRFSDLREGDRDQLQREQGLNRELLSVQSAKFNASSQKVETEDGRGFYRRSLESSLFGVKFGLQDQAVESGFNRFWSLRENDRDQLSREAGLARQSMTFQFKGAFFDQKQVRSDTGSLTSSSAGIKLGSFQTQYSSHSTDPGFNRFWSLTGQEQGEAITSILRMNQPDANPQGGDWGQYGQSSGLNRTSFQAQLGLRGNSALRFKQSAVGDANGTARLNEIAADLGRTKFSIRSQRVDDTANFSSRLLTSEQQRLGISPGLNKTDLAFESDLGKGAKVEFGTMKAEDNTGSASRVSANLDTKNFGLKLIQRSLTPQFQAVGTMYDSERDLFTQMLGQSQSEWSARWNINSRIGLNSWSSKADGIGDILGHDRSRHSVDFQLDRKTKLTLGANHDSSIRNGVSERDARNSIFGVSRDFGRFGTLGFSSESWSYRGSLDQAPDAKQDSVDYATQLTKHLGWQVRQSKTQFSNGSRESMLSNTINFAVNSRLGVNVTESRTQREGENRDETQRSFGLAYDFGKGIKFQWNNARQLQGDSGGGLQSNVSMSAGAFQGVKVDQANYQRAGWDHQRDQHLGQFNFSNAAPLQWGSLRDVRFHVRADSSRDYFVWQKEDQSYGFGTNIGSSSIDLGYVSQVSGNGYRAVDRKIKFVSDRSEKAPFRFAIDYGQRTLPGDQLVAIRDYRIFWKVNRDLELEHSIQTNSLQQQGGVLLNSVPIDERKNSWSLKWRGKGSANATFQWNERKRDNTQDAIFREALVKSTFFANNPSPLDLQYGLVQWERNGQRQTNHKFGISFTQRPGPNQSFVFTLENMNFEHSVQQGFKPQNWQMRLDFFSRKWGL